MSEAQQQSSTKAMFAGCGLVVELKIPTAKVKSYQTFEWKGAKGVEEESADIGAQSKDANTPSSADMIIQCCQMPRVGCLVVFVDLAS